MGISLPSAAGQEEVMRKAYAKAGIDNFSETDYIECHGTGTPVGDPIDVVGVSGFFKLVVDTGTFLIGSVSIYPLPYSICLLMILQGQNKPRSQRGN